MSLLDKLSAEERRDYKRGALRFAIVSAFWGVIQHRKTQSGFTLQQLADKVGTNKSTVSRWFSAALPNWEIDTMADIADALEVELEIRVNDKKSGRVYSPTGLVVAEPVAATMVSSNGTTFHDWLGQMQFEQPKSSANITTKKVAA